MEQNVDSLLKYYEITWLPYSDGSRVAKPLGHDHTFAYRLDDPGALDEVPELSWGWLSGTHEPDDIICTIDGVRLVSPLVKNILDEHRTAIDIIQWLEAVTITPAGETLPYWVPHFPVPHDLIDVDNSTFGPSGLPIRYSLSREKLAGHAVTIIPRTPFTYILAQQVVDALQTAEAKGILVMPARVT